MRFLLSSIVFLILMSPIGLLALGWFALEGTPLIAGSGQLGHTDIARARDIIKRNDPRGLPAGTLRRVEMAESDLELVANYLLQPLGGSVGLKVYRDGADLAASLRLPALPSRQYLNLSMTIEDTGESLDVDSLRIGKLWVPEPLTDWAAEKLLEYAAARSEFHLARDVVDELTLLPAMVSITYLWRPDIIDRSRDQLISGSDRKALVAYYNKLASLHATGKSRNGAVSTALQPLFAEARRRSADGDPVVENRALLLVLGAWATGRGLDRLVPPEQRQGRLAAYRLAFDGRGDLSQHFLTSAALTAAADNVLSNAIGLFKEVDDAAGGSGFSFSDLAADRAGTRFGEMATGSTNSARALQSSVAGGLQDRDIMPPAGDLPERMAQSEFERRYGGIGSPRYNEVIAEIERRLSTCSLYQ